MSTNNDNTTGNLLDFSYFKKHYKLIVINLHKQTKLKYLQQISFIGELPNTLGATMFFIMKNQKNHINNENAKDCKFLKLH